MKLILSIVTILLSGLIAFINLREFYIVKILSETAKYPFGGEGPVPYYYKSSELYSKVVLIWGIIFITILILGIISTIRVQNKIIRKLFIINLSLIGLNIIQGFF
ncbi:hypothetical protein [Christiangramia aestuarii]|uniref:Uncharacterized protein n=1 Tax=Christiangramia aestuarii TaxID=1028746 RepID=A0A7K1LT22_9FLAO|nr:hypothetical protein [Christiangramia aestuarii]MUP43962.1 hypothetical protein [Christiangramia aestuarii]